MEFVVFFKQKTRVQRRLSTIAGMQFRPLLPRLKQGASSYLPAFLMAGLALGTWWLVRVTPPPAAPKAAMSHEKRMDYDMQGFVTSRFAADGQVLDDLRGEQLRHFSTGELEVDAPRLLRQTAADTVIQAAAERAYGDDGGSEVTLQGQVDVQRQHGTERLRIQGEEIAITDHGERLHSQRPVRITRGGMRLQAGSLLYEAESGQLQLGQGVRGHFPAR